jgi:hypothetical protein
MTAVRTFKKHTPAKKMMGHRQAWLRDDNEFYVIFGIYSRDGNQVYEQAIRKIDLHTTCTCEYAEEWGRNDPNGCWHMRKAMHSYLLRIQRGEVL